MTPTERERMLREATAAFAAVTARIEAEVAKALSGDAFLAQYVAAALSQQVEVKDQRSYNTKRVPYLTHVLEEAIKEATKDAVVRLIAEELPTIEAEVRKALRRQVTGIAESLARSLNTAAKTAYGVNVDLTLRMPNQ